MTAYTLFGQSTETVTAAGATGGGSLGTQFTVSSAGTLTGIWLYSPSGHSLTGVPGVIALYNSSGTLIHSETASWSGAAGSGWIRAAFSSPPTVSTGVTYRAVTFDSSATAVWFIYNSSSWGSSITSGPLAAAAASQGWYSTTTSGVSYPTSQLATYNWYLDPEVTSGSTSHTATGADTVTPSDSATAVHGNRPSGSVTVTPVTAAAGHASGPHTASAAVTVTPVTAASPAGGASGLLTQGGGALLDQAAGPLQSQGNGAPVAHTAGASLTVQPATAATSSSGGLLTQGGGALLDQAAGPLQNQAGGAPVAHTASAAVTVQPAAAARASGGNTPVVKAFPDQPLDVRAELQVNGTWTDVTSDMDHGPVTAGRGHPDESTTVSPSTLSLTLTNSGARYSPDNVMSDLWPFVLQNTPVRVSIPAQSPYLRLEADQDDRAYVNGNSNLDITGPLEARIALRLSDWRGCVLAAKWDGAVQSWYWVLNPDATMTFSWFDAGGTQRTVSSAPVPYLTSSMVLVVFLDTTSSTVYFYGGPGEHADDTAGVNLLTGVTYNTPGSVRAGSAPLVVGWSANGITDQVQMFGRVLEFKLYSLTAGVSLAVADAVFYDQPAGATSWTDDQGNLWQLAGGAELSDRDYRAHQEAAEHPQDEPPYNPDSEDAEQDALVELVGGGLLRRYSQRNNPVQSAMYRAVLKQSGQLSPPAYWPMEDLAGSTSLGSATSGPPMNINGTPALAADSSFIASNPLPTLGGAVLSGQVPAYTSNGSLVTRFLGKVGTLPGSSYATLMRVSSSGTVRSLYVVVYADGGLGLIGYDSQGGAVVSTTEAAWSGGVSGKNFWYSVEAVPVTGGVKYTLLTVAPGATTGLFVSQTITSAVVGNATEVTVNPNGFFTDTAVGHVSVQSADSSLFSLGSALNGWQGEPAGTRFARLCAEEGVQCRTRGNLAATTLMGAQTPQTLVQLLQSCADADQAAWTETRQCLGWGFTTRRALYGQAATAGLDYSLDHLSPWSSPPTRDDQFIVNDVTYQNSGGSSARAYAAPGQPIPGGRMSTLAPKDGGVGTYDQQYPVAVQNDSDLLNLAGWKLRLGTVDQARLPGISIDLTGRDLADEFWDVLDMDLGARLTIASPPPRLGPDTITQLAQQLTEELWHDTLTVTVTGVPELPYQVARAGTAHLAPAAAQLGAGAGEDDATLLLFTPAANLAWSASPGDYPFNVKADGEEITITGVTGVSFQTATIRGVTQTVSAQTATVTRSVNGVVKSHSSGAAVTMNPPVTVGL